MVTNESAPKELEAHYSNLTFLSIVSHLNDWSTRQFGSVATRGPLGPLEHLEQEVTDELRTEVERLLACDDAEQRVQIRKELAEEASDAIILSIDTAFRSGITAAEMTHALKQKINIIVNRKYPDMAKQDMNAPVYHSKDNNA